MNKVIGSFVCVSGLLLAFGVDVSTIIGGVTSFLIIGGAFYYLCRGKLPENFWLMVFGVFFGPILLASLIRALCRAIWNYLVSTLGIFAPLPLILGGLAVAFLAYLYVRPRISALLGDQDTQSFINERHPVLPPQQERGELVCIEQESDSSNESEDED
ncbi:MAG TPA: hypothetical protein VGV59_18160 [Pyrinomonadaceae bacterium]|nr:hypothetical protein [Pyrinomonadaceae bacterium]